jgi:hypothetical protein
MAKAVASSAAAISTTARPGSATCASRIALMPGTTRWRCRQFSVPGSITRPCASARSLMIVNGHRRLDVRSRMREG